ncbi:MAG TPA: type II toxin-antitoxin system VapC family toxin [Longimicrobiaceae bacterium]|nr:type II toxin-antitoxin system VapC family toxin [Longimicrobiaceae bacterium]
MPELPARLLLDTHVWIWLMEGAAAEVAPSVLERIRQASARGMVLVSAISAWEVAMLAAKGRIRLAMEVGEWVRRGLAAPGVRLAELSPEILVESTRLPGEVHGDPADRMLIATARRVGAALVTRDAAILAYARDGHLAVVDATP